MSLVYTGKLSLHVTGYNYNNPKEEFSINIFKVFKNQLIISLQQNSCSCLLVNSGIWEIFKREFPLKKKKKDDFS